MSLGLEVDLGEPASCEYLGPSDIEMLFHNSFPQVDDFFIEVVGF